MKIKIGKITGAQGLRGEVRIYHDSGDESALRRLSTLYVLQDGSEQPYPILGLRMQKRVPILRLEGVEHRDAAEALVGAELLADYAESRPDEADTWLVSELLGLGVYYEKDGTSAGILRRIIDNPAHDILEIETEDGVRLLPFVDVFVRVADDARERRILITPPEGWEGVS